MSFVDKYILTDKNISNNNMSFQLGDIKHSREFIIHLLYGTGHNVLCRGIISNMIMLRWFVLVVLNAIDLCRCEKVERRTWMKTPMKNHQPSVGY